MDSYPHDDNESTPTHGDPAEIVSLLREIADRLSAPPKRWLSIAAAADYASLSRDSIRYLLDSGKLAARRPVRGRVVIDRLELDSLIDGATSTPRHRRGQYDRRRSTDARARCSARPSPQTPGGGGAREMPKGGE